MPTPPFLAGQRITAAGLNALPGDIVTLTTGLVTNLNTEQTIGTFSACIPANDAVVNGGYRFLIFGTTDNASTPTCRWRLYVGSALAAQTIFDTSALTMSGAGTANAYTILAWMMVTATGVSGTFESMGLFNSGHVNGNQAYQSRTANTINTTTSNDVILTAQWGTASSSNTARTLTGSAQRT